jgi:Ca-activated chloride channel family protein
MRFLTKLLWTFFALLFASAAQAQDLPRTIIVMDGSGSMWGQIEGRPKLEIARETVAEVLQTIPAEQELGLMAYGHRVKGDCTDIELVVPPTAGTAAQIIATVNDMRFLGKTPLSNAVLQAAEALHYSETAATVVLVTDGLETCDADPCALGLALEAAGLDFTTHVIGFGLTAEEGAQVSCLAENTGGRYFAAGDSMALSDALATSVASSTAPIAEPEILPLATITAPDEAIVGSVIDIGWTGPDEHLDTIEIGLPGDGAGRFYTYTTDGNPLTLQMPAEPGAYELRYKHGDNTLLASRAIAVIEATVSLDAPALVHADSEVLVSWVGPNAEYDTIILRLPGDDSYITYAYVSAGNPVGIWAPAEPGQYELAYKLNDSEVLATRAIEVVPQGTEIANLDAAEPTSGPVPISLEADMGEMGFSVVWSAVPVPGQDLPPEAFAMQEGTAEPLEADFLPGDYEVRGDAGDQVFAGRISVVAGAENRFVIPYSAALSPAGEDAPGPDVAAVSISGETYDGMFKRWTATPLDGADDTMIDSGDYNPRWWETTLTHGAWRVEGTAEGASRPLFSGEIVIAADGPSEFRIPLAAENAQTSGSKTKTPDGTPIAAPDGIDLRELLTYPDVEN